jgi:hypothetical protein
MNSIDSQPNRQGLSGGAAHYRCGFKFCEGLLERIQIRPVEGQAKKICQVRALGLAAGACVVFWGRPSVLLCFELCLIPSVTLSSLHSISLMLQIRKKNRFLKVGFSPFFLGSAPLPIHLTKPATHIRFSRLDS